MEHVRSMLIEREKEKGAMHQRIKELTDHRSRLEEEARGKLDSHPCCVGAGRKYGQER